MGNIGEPINPFNPDVENDSMSSKWFYMRAAQIATLGGIGAAMYKMRGATGQLVQKYIDRQANSRLSKEMLKAEDQQDWLLNNHAEVRPPHFGLPEINEEIIAPELKQTHFPSTAEAGNMLDAVENLEESILTRTQTDIAFSKGSQLRKRVGGPNPILPKEAPDLGDAAKNDIFWEARTEALFNFLQRNTPLDSNDAADLTSMLKRGSPTDKKSLAEKHKAYVSMYPEYAREYKKLLTRAKKQYIAEKASYEANPSNAAKELQESEVKKFLYGAQGFSKDATVPIDTIFSAKTQGTPRQVNIKEILSTGAQITSGSLDKSVKLRSGSTFAQLGQFNYFGHIKRIVDAIDEINTERQAELNIDKVDYEVVTKGTRDYHLRLSFIFRDQTDPMFIEVPLPQYGRVPASTPSGASRLDRAYELPNGVRRLKDHVQLKINDNIENIGQRALRQLAEDLEGRKIEDAGRDPYGTIKKIQRSVNNIVTSAPVNTGTVAESVKALTIKPAFTKDRFSRNQLKMLDDAVASGSNIKRLGNILSERRSAINVTLDFEAIAADVGPEHMATSAETQITKAGILVMDISNGDINATARSEEIVSDHGIDVLKNHKINDRTANWLSRELPEKIEVDGKMMNTKEVAQTNPDLLFKIWGEKRLRPSAEAYRTRRGGQRFKNNTDFMEHVGKKIIAILDDAARSGKEAFVTTKNGNQFDLRLLELNAPKAWAELQKKHRHMIDLQSIAYFRKEGYGGLKTLGMNRIIQQMMGNLDPNMKAYNIDKGKLSDAINFLNKQKGYKIASTTFMNTLKDQGINLQEAHSTPLGDSIVESFYLLDEVQKYKKGDKLYSDLDELHSWVSRQNRIVGMDESIHEYRALELGYTAYGRVTSASMLSQGNIHKEIASAFTPNQFFSFPDIKLSKQLYQLHRGHGNMPSTSYLTKKFGTDLEKKKQFARKNFVRSIVTQGQLDAEEYMRKVGDMPAAMSHQMMADTLFTWNPFRGREGYASVAEDVWNMRQFHFDFKVPLNPEGHLNNPELKDSFIRLQSDTNTIGKKIMEAKGLQGSMPSEVRQQAVREALAKNGPIQIGAGKEVLVRGERGYKSVRLDFAGHIHDIIAEEEQPGKILLYAHLKSVANGEDMSKVAARARVLGNKSLIMTDRQISLGTAMGGPQAVMDAEFLRKGHVGALKQMVAEQINDRFNDSLSNDNIPEREKDLMKRSQKNFLLKMNATQNSLGQVVVDQNKSITSKMRHIKDPVIKEKAQQYIGNIDFDSSSMMKYMRQTGMIWKAEDAIDYYKMAGGYEKARTSVINSIHEATKGIDEMTDEKNGVLAELDPRQKTRIKRDMIVTMKNFLLPNVKQIKAGKKVPTIFGFHDELKAIEGAPRQFGFRTRTGVTVYGLNRGQQAELIDMKFKGDVLKMLVDTGSRISQTSLDFIKSNVNYANQKRFLEAAKTLGKFTDRLLSSALTSGAELNLNDLNVLIDRVGDIDLEKMSKRALSETELDEAVKRASDLIVEGRDGEELQNLVDRVVSDVKTFDAVEAFRKNENMVSLSAVSRIAKLAQDKDNLFQYSVRPELGGALSFTLDDIGQIMQKSGMDESKMDMVKGFFDRLAKDSDIVEIDPDDPNRFRIKKIVWHADATPENIWNSLNPKAREDQIGLLNNAARKRKDSALALKKLEDMFETLREKGEKNITKNESFKVSARLASSQWLRYLLDGFLLDSNSVYKRSHDISLKGMFTSIAGVEQVLSRARSLFEIGGLSELKSVDDKLKTLHHAKIEHADKILREVIKDTAVTDVFVTRSHFDNLKFREGRKELTIKQKIRQMVGDPEKANEIYEEMASGAKRAPMFAIGNPPFQNAIDAALDLNYRVIPDELAPYLNMNANVANVFMEIAKLQARDFDGDQEFHSYKDMKTIEELQKWHSEHKVRLKRTMDALAVQGYLDEDKRLAYNVDGFLENGRSVAMGVDENGNFIYDIGRHKAGVEDITSQMAGLANQQNINTAANVTERYIKDAFDQVAFVGVSKNLIGPTTNAYRRRVSQIMQAGVIRDPADRALLIGNANFGLGKLNQDAISFAKHGSGMKQKAKMSAAFIKGFPSDANERKAFEQEFFAAYEHTKVPTKKRQELLDMYYASLKQHKKLTKDEMARNTIRSLTDIDLGKQGTNIIDQVVSRSDFEIFQAASEFAERPGAEIRGLGDTLMKRFKIQPEFPKAFTRKAGKFGLVGALGYMALNFFRPNQLSQSWNPLDAFTDLGVDPNGDYTRVGSELELDRRIPLDTVDASFSKQAFIKLQNYNNNYREDKGRVVREMLNNSFQNFDVFKKDQRESQRTTYSNYTSHIGSFGNNTLQRRSTLI